MIYDRLIELIERGTGQGHFDDYVPMWQVARGNPTRYGVQGTGPMPGYHRGSSFRQRTHRRVALLVLWLGGLDVRENYPLWPFSHPHPLSDWPLGTPVDKVCHGLLDVVKDQAEKKCLCRRARAGSVPEITLMITRGDREHPESLLLACRSCDEKSQDLAIPTANTAEYGRRYAIANDIPYRELDPNSIGQTLIANLIVWSFAVNAVRRDIASQERARIEDALLKSLEDDTIAGAVRHASNQLGLPERRVWTVFAYMQWTQAVDIDPSRPIFHTEQPQAGGRALKATLARLILGDPS